MQNKLIIRCRNSNGRIKNVPLHPDSILAAENCSITAVRRFFEKVEKSPGCWLWTGCMTNSGPVIGRGGRINNGHENISARALSWLIHFGALPEGNGRIFTSCDRKRCLNPEHFLLAEGRTLPEIDYARAETLLAMKMPDHGYCEQDPPFLQDSLARSALGSGTESIRLIRAGCGRHTSTMTDTGTSERGGASPVKFCVPMSLRGLSTMALSPMGCACFTTAPEETTERVSILHTSGSVPSNRTTGMRLRRIADWAEAIGMPS